MTGSNTVERSRQLTSSLAAPEQGRRLQPAVYAWRGQSRLGLGANDDTHDAVPTLTVGIKALFRVASSYRTIRRTRSIHMGQCG